MSAATTKVLLQSAPTKDFARAREKDCMRSRTPHCLKVIRMCTRARLAGTMKNSFLFSLFCLTKRKGIGARGSHPMTPASRTILRRRLNRVRRVIIPEPPGLELPGLSDFLSVRGVETEARVVQRGVTANAKSRLRQTLCPKKSATSVSLASFRLFNGGSRQELGRAGKDYHVLPPAVINADTTISECIKVEILDWSFFYPDGLKIERVENQIRSGRRNNVQISMYEQRGQIEQAKHRLCTLLHLRRHE